MITSNLMTLPLAGFWFREGASNFSSDVDFLFDLILWISIAFFVLIVGGMALFVFRYRMRPGHTEEHSPHHNNTIEVAWTVIPTLIVMVIFLLGFVYFVQMSTPPEDAYEINVIAKKWAWNFRYGRGDATIDSPDLHVWMDQDFKLIQQSDDVIHSLFIPAFRVKMDCVPGRYTYQWFRVNRMPDPYDDCNIDNAGRMEDGSDMPVGFDIFCTEYCGTGHSSMNAKVVVHESKAAFDKWLEEFSTIFQNADGEAVPLEEVGEVLYTRKGCIQCHSLDGTAKVGPSFKTTADQWGSDQAMAAGSATIDENYVRESILNPNAKIRAGYKPAMPSYQGQLKDTAERPELGALIAFIKSLKKE
jgi:cytochrome c oxidase subunit 2